MSKGIAIRLTGTLVLSAVLFLKGYPQDSSVPPVRIMFYNVENCFDTYDDTLTDDDEFTPGGVMRWNFTRYKKKINAIYKTITAAGGWEPPALIALCEIENRKVLEDLVIGTNLSKYGYSIIHEESPDLRGIDVCLIYRKDIIEIVKHKYWIPENTSITDFETRSVLYTKCAVRKDTLHIIVNHWPSKRGGVLSEENLRSELADMIRCRADSIASADTDGAKILIMGDFNCPPNSPVMKTLTGGTGSGVSLINLSESKPEWNGTYRYKGIWEMIDQVIVTLQLLDCKEGLFTGSDSFRVFQPDFLMRKDPRYPGVSPFSTYQGYRYQGGFSDHLPILIDLMIRPKDLKE